MARCGDLGNASPLRGQPFTALAGFAIVHRAS
jgi:hypothetical protein